MKIWLPVIFFACLVAGALAYRAALPPQAETPPPIAANAFDTAAIVERLEAAGRQYAARVAAQQRLRAVERATLAYLRAIPRDAPGPAVPGLGENGGAQQRLAEFDAWGGGLPAAHVRTAAGEVTFKAKRARVAATFGVRVNTATRGRVVFATRPTVHLKRSGGSWRVVDVRAGRSGIRAIPAPVLVTAGPAWVLANGTNATFARDVAATAATAIPQLRARYRKVAGPRRAFMLVADTTAQVAQVLGRADRPRVPHPTGWTYENGDVVLLWPNLRGQPPIARATTVRHEILHVVALPLLRRTPTMLLEGIALFEEVPPSVPRGRFVLDLARLRAAFRAQDLGYQDLLHSTQPAFGRTSAEGITLGYLAGYATVAYIEDEHGHGKLIELLAALRGGDDVDAALEQALGLNPVQLQARVKEWVQDAA